METFMKIGSAVLIIAMIAMIWPRAKVMMQESKETPSDWPAVVVPLLLVVGFIMLLISMV